MYSIRRLCSVIFRLVSICRVPICLVPEFGILDTSSSYARANFINTLFLANGGNGIPVSAPNRPQGTQISFCQFSGFIDHAPAVG